MVRVSLWVDRGFVVLIFVAIAVGVVSIAIHSPSTPTPLGLQGFKYSDIVHGVFYSVFGYETLLNPSKLRERWFHPQVFEDLAYRVKLCPVPYIDYRFEYPPLVGLLWWFSTCLAIHTVFPQRHLVIEYPHLISEAANIHFAIHALTLCISLVVLTYLLYRIAKILGLGWKRVALFLLLPSTVIYTVYNWDILTSMFMVGGIYAYLRGRYLLSGALLGLAISVKIVPIAIAMVLLYELIQKRFRGEDGGALGRYTISLVLTSLTPFAILALIAPEGFNAMIQHHASWYCENCFSMLLYPHDLWSPIHRVVTMVMVPLILMILAIRPLDTPQSVIEISAAAVLGTILFSYVFSPQMMLMITPLLILAISSRVDLYTAIVADSMNAAMIVLFFEDSALRNILAPILGIATGYNPWSLDSPAQWAAQIRNILLFILLISIVTTSLRRLRSTSIGER